MTARGHAPPTPDAHRRRMPISRGPAIGWTAAACVRIFGASHFVITRRSRPVSRLPLALLEGLAVIVISAVVSTALTVLVLLWGVQGDDRAAWTSSTGYLELAPPSPPRARAAHHPARRVAAA